MFCWLFIVCAYLNESPLPVSILTLYTAAGDVLRKWKSSYIWPSSPRRKKICLRWFSNNKGTYNQTIFGASSRILWWVVTTNLFSVKFTDLLDVFSFLDNLNFESIFILGMFIIWLDSMKTKRTMKKKVSFFLLWKLHRIYNVVILHYLQQYEGYKKCKCWKHLCLLYFLRIIIFKYRDSEGIISC